VAGGAHATRAAAIVTQRNITARIYYGRRRGVTT